MTQKQLLVLVAALSISAGAIGGAAGGILIPLSLGSSSQAWLSRELREIQSSITDRRPTMDDGTMEVVKRASPAVVSIVASRGLTDEESSLDIFDPFSDRRGIPDVNSSTDRSSLDDSRFIPERFPIGAGSGFFVSSTGLIVTNRHVVQDKRATYTVITQDGVHHQATVVAIDPSMDLAFVRIPQVDGKPYPVLPLGDGDAIGVGQTVIAIGNALAEFQNSVTKGVISGMHRRLVAGTQGAESEVIEEAIQTDAAINPGNSGGPLLNLDGEVIGVNTAISEDAQSLGFALPVQAVKRNILSLERYGRIVRPWLGVRYTHITPESAEREQLPYPYGAQILRGRTRSDLAVIPGSPADKAGLKEGDLILEVQGQKIDEMHPLASVLLRYMPQDQIRVRIVRDGAEQELTVTLDERRTDE